MQFQTHTPHPDLAALVKCYWTLEGTPEPAARRQRVLPDGCLELAFLLADDVLSLDAQGVLRPQPRSMVLGQLTRPLVIEPMGRVETFAVKFYPFGLSNFVSVDLHTLRDRETPVEDLWGEPARDLIRAVERAPHTPARIEAVEAFLLALLAQHSTVEHLCRRTVAALWATQGRADLGELWTDHRPQKRQIERNFLKHVGVPAKQLGRILRFQAALEALLEGDHDSLGRVAYDLDYYDQAHFIRDFRAFTGTNPRGLSTDNALVLSTLFAKPGK